MSFLDQKSEAIISKYLGKKFLVGKANYSFLFWNIYDAELYSTSKKYNSNDYMQSKIEEKTDLAIKSLDGLSESKYKDELVDLALFCIFKNGKIIKDLSIFSLFKFK